MGSPFPKFSPSSNVTGVGLEMFYLEIFVSTSESLYPHLFNVSGNKRQRNAPAIDNAPKMSGGIAKKKFPV